MYSNRSPHRNKPIRMSRNITDISLYGQNKVLNNPTGQNCYKTRIASVKNDAEWENFIKKLNFQEPTEDGFEAAASIPMMENEDIELILEHMTLHCNFKEEDTNTLCPPTKYESYFNAAFYNLMKDKASYEKLQEICRNNEAKRGADIYRAMTEHSQRVDETSSYFTDHGLSQDEAKAASLAISFYTGTKSGVIDQGRDHGKQIQYRTQKILIDKKEEEEPIETFIICNYLLRGISKISYYRGYVSRSCRLTDEELKFYTAGSVIIWSQFNGTFKGKRILDSFDFSTRNTFFRIYSLTGRPINTFSNFDDEDEILFLPDSTFLVLKHVVSHHGSQHTIYMRQVELGLSTSSILWVDDQIFQDNWNNTGYMIYAETKDMKKNIRFIQKSNTNNALSFLRSPFGQLLKNRYTFRIVTDMHRGNEQPAPNAGARFIKNLRMLGFNNACMLFVGNKQNAEQLISTELTPEEREHIKITTNEDELKNFIDFDSRY
ncbi:unnamed protein product [Rotaria sp. Silwood1]|nr:unnamed protein product [Rotaria sp. Silwood1]CAF1659032.1 unnamed protein product [Rotaria sp. Silwood1]